MDLDADKTPSPTAADEPGASASSFRSRLDARVASLLFAVAAALLAVAFPRLELSAASAEPSFELHVF
uniref:hypothetical protein n=1 Tax=Salmonella sp. SAL4446 TaxID=3159901 RepID=UPI00397A7C36